MSLKNSYDDSAIKALEGASRVRTRPASMLGSKGLDGAKHTVYEIIGNCSDERLAGFGDKLDIVHYADGAISVRDYGRGVPLGWNEKFQKWNWFLVYEELYAGAKYSDYQEELRKVTDWDNFRIEDYPYLITVGMNGVGAAATQYTSEYFTVTSFKDGEAKTMEYKKGVHVLDELRVEKTDEPNGTYVKWKPDKEVFTDVNIPTKWFEKLCEGLSYTSGFTVTFYDEIENIRKVYERETIESAMEKKTGACASGHSFSHIEDEEGDICVCIADVVVGPTGAGKAFYNNMVGVSGGVHATAWAWALSDFFTAIAKERNVKISVSDYSNKFSVIVSSLNSKVSYRGQTKDSLDDTYVMRCIYDALKKALDLEYTKGSDWLMDAIEEVVKTAENRIAVQELTKNFKEISKSSRKGKASQKFRTCIAYEEKRPEEVEWWIMEGDSAGNAFGEARDSRYQCYLTIRGKALNVYKATMDRLIANNEIKDMISILGTGVELGIDGYASFDISKLRVGRVIFCADADVDGKHINMLLFLIFLRLFPRLLYDGYVYVAETPLHVIELNDGSSIYCYSDEEKEEKLKEVVGVRRVTRFKGLGEVNSDQLWETTINPDTRKLKQIKIDENDMDIYDVVECLFGKSTDRRREKILGSMLGEDISDVMGSIDDMVEYINNLDLTDLNVVEVEY